jgi:glutamyl-tRNA reductase
VLKVGVIGISFKTADLELREAVARGAESLSGSGAVFFPHTTVLLSTCNRTEIYFSSDDLSAAHSDILALLRSRIDVPFEHRLYSYFGMDCFYHLSRVASGLDSAILAETDIQRQVKLAYTRSEIVLPAGLHYIFQKALKIGKNVRTEFEFATSLYGRLWQTAVERLGDLKKRRILLVGYSEINRGLISFLGHKGIDRVTICTRADVEGAVDRRELSKWREYDWIVCATKADGYLIEGNSDREHLIFDLSVPRVVDPDVGATLYNIEEIHSWVEQKNIGHIDAFVRENIVRLSQIYKLKTQRSLESVGRG